VLLETNAARIVGFYSLSATIIDLGHLPDDIKAQLGLRYPAPAILLAQLAVDRELHGRGLGKAMLAHALRIANDASELIGAMAIATEAIDDDARRFYEHHGFRPLARAGTHLFLPMTAVPVRQS
jgi:GNAT superfamily N-acetyltransferase